MKLLTSTVPYSRYGSYLGICTEENTLMVYHAWHRFEAGEALRVSFPQEVSFESRISGVTAVGKNGTVTFKLCENHALVMICQNLPCYLEQVDAYGYGFPLDKNRVEMISVGNAEYIQMTCQEGTFTQTENHTPIKDWTVRDHRLRVETSENARVFVRVGQTENWHCPTKEEQEKDFEESLRHWEDFYSRMPPVEKQYEEQAFVAWYAMWSAYVPKGHVYQYDAMLMSKKYMSSVWSWDHCFNALALVKTMPERALEQFFLPFKLQSPSGALPDMFNENSQVVWGVTKPPIHGWCFSKMRKAHEYTKEEVKTAYDYLEKWTNWWLTYRTMEGSELPFYPQGCDSGWDNSTSFDHSYAVCTPDLSAYLVLQMKELSQLARILGREEEEKAWKEKSEKLLSTLLRVSFYDGRFHSLRAGSNETEKEEKSLIRMMPLVLGEMLPTDVVDQVTKDLMENYMTAYGLATEQTDSEKYESDGYWRGPIWAPVTYLIVDGLRRAGKKEEAHKIACAFVKMAGEKGNWENFDALTGKGLRAPGYTWTASVHMRMLYALTEGSL